MTKYSSLKTRITRHFVSKTMRCGCKLMHIMVKFYHRHTDKTHIIFKSKHHTFPYPSAFCDKTLHFILLYNAASAATLPKAKKSGGAKSRVSPLHPRLKRRRSFQFTSSESRNAFITFTAPSTPLFPEFIIRSYPSILPHLLPV